MNSIIVIDQLLPAYEVYNYSSKWMKKDNLSSLNIKNPMEMSLLVALANLKYSD